MTSLTDTQVITASGGLVELGYVERTTNQSVTATTFAGAAEVFATDLAFVADGSPVIVEFYCPQVALGGNYIIFNLSNGSTTDMGQIGYAGASSTVHTQYRYTPSAGAQTINVRAWVQSGTGQVLAGAGGSGQYPPAFLRVSKIVTATQWPAVTTGTIICTSSTRPASPFAGQTIYETDTSLSRIYNGSAWVAPQYQTRVPALSYYWSNVSTTGFSQLVVSGAPTTTQYDSGDISYNSSTGVFTLPKNGLYMASFYASPVSGSGFFPVTISVDAASGATQTPTYIGNSYSGAGWASYTTMNASGIFAANGDRQIRFRIYTSATSGFEAFVRLAWISST